MYDPAYDDAARLRILQADADDAATRRIPTVTHGAPCVVAKVVSSTVSATLEFYNLQAQLVTGPLVEGGLGVLTSAGYDFLAINLGSAIPGVGTPVICTFMDFRWAFRYDG